MKEEFSIDETAITLTEAETQAIVDKWNTQNNADTYVVQLGGTERDAPPEALRPITAKDLTELNPADHAYLHANYLNWLSYLTPQHARVKAHLLQAENTISALRVAISARLRQAQKPGAKKMSQSELDMYVELDPTMQNIMVQRQELTQINLMVAAEVDVCKRNMAVISREIEVTKLERAQTVVGSNVAGRVAAASTGRPHSPYGGGRYGGSG